MRIRINSYCPRKLKARQLDNKITIETKSQKMERKMRQFEDIYGLINNNFFFAYGHTKKNHQYPCRRLK